MLYNREMDHYCFVECEIILACLNPGVYNLQLLEITQAVEQLLH